jgi:2'-5' RNA ligase
MNHFFAIELSPEARQEVWAKSQEWQRLLGPSFRANWYAPEEYHVTLKFLGDVEEERQPDLITAVTPVAASTAPFVPGLESVGAFPGLHRPHVLWAGVSAGPALADLAARLDVALTGIGFAPESRPYRPHVTIARCRPTPEMGEWPAPREHLFDEWWTTRLVLMQTLPPEQRANGAKARYNTVHTFPLGNTQLSDET